MSHVVIRRSALALAVPMMLAGCASTVVDAQWKSVEDYEAMRRDPHPLPFFEEALTLATFDPGMYEVGRTFSPVWSP